MEKRIADRVALSKEANEFVSRIAPLPSGALLVTLSGELGAGKTAFTQEVARALGLEETVTSPTFVLEKIYKLSGKNFARLVHIDAYRLQSGEELGPLGFDELMRDPSNLVLLEWPEKVKEALPEAAVRINIEALPEGARLFTYG